MMKRHSETQSSLEEATLHFFELGQLGRGTLSLCTVKISQKQTKEFACAILESIEPYVQEHQKEFEQFLKEDQENKEV